MKRYTITTRQGTYQLETPDLNILYPNGLPTEFIDAEITEVDITEELEQRRIAEEAAKLAKKEKLDKLKLLKGKDYSKDEIKQILDHYLEGL